MLPVILIFLTQISLIFFQTPSPYDMEINIKDPITGNEINRPLQSGEYVWVTSRFVIRSKSQSDYTVTLTISVNDYATLCCPHIVRTGSDLIWGNRPTGCLTQVQK